MIEYLFYTDEGSTQSPTGKEVENLQILGVSIGKNYQMAFKSLFKDNKWIVDSGFNPDCIKYYQLHKT